MCAIRKPTSCLICLVQHIVIIAFDIHSSLTGLPRSGKNENFSRSGKSQGIFLKSQGKSLILAKSVKSQGTPFSGLNIANMFSAQFFNTFSSEKG